MAPPNSSESVIGPSTQLTGRVAGRGGVRVEGSVKGDVEVDGPSEIADGGSVAGNVSAGSLDIAGSLNGDATTDGPIRVRRTATVRGQLSGAEISIEQGARVAVVLDARFDLDV